MSGSGSEFIGFWFDWPLILGSDGHCNFLNFFGFGFNGFVELHQRSGQTIGFCIKKVPKYCRFLIFWLWVLNCFNFRVLLGSHFGILKFLSFGFYGHGKLLLVRVGFPGLSKPDPTLLLSVFWSLLQKEVIFGFFRLWPTHVS